MSIKVLRNTWGKFIFIYVIINRTYGSIILCPRKSKYIRANADVAGVIDTLDCTRVRTHEKNCVGNEYSGAASKLSLRELIAMRDRINCRALFSTLRSLLPERPIASNSPGAVVGQC